MWIQDLIEVNKENETLIISFYNVEFLSEGDVLIAKCPQIKYRYLQLKEKELVEKIARKLGKKFNLNIEVINDTKELEEEKTEPQEKGKLIFPVSLNSEYTFDTFIHGESNKFAMSCISNVLNSSEKDPRFLYLWGRPGVGKSHCLVAAAHYLLVRGKNIAFFNGKDFVTFVVKLLSRSLPQEQLQQEKAVLEADVLLIDDIQFIIKKPKTQEELKYFLDHYINTHKYLCVVSDRPPDELVDVPPEITTRLSVGYVSDIAPPDFELKKALLLRELDKKHAEIPERIFDLIVRADIPSARQIILIANTIANMVQVGEDITDKSIEYTFKKIKVNPISIKEYKVRSTIERYAPDLTLEELQGRITRSLLPQRNHIVKELIKDPDFKKNEIATIFKVTKGLITQITLEKKGGDKNVS